MEQNTPLKAHVLISGKVQGVGYRYYTAKQAQAFKLNGWVQNLPDGRVEAVFEGQRPMVEKMIQWCHRGSPSAIVTDVAVRIEAWEGLQGFEMRR